MITSTNQIKVELAENEIFKVEDLAVTYVITKSNNTNRINFIDENDPYATYYGSNYSKVGNDLYITPVISATVSVILKDYFLQSPETVLNNVEGSPISYISVEGRGQINGTYLNDNIYGSEISDTVYSSDGFDNVYTYEGNDTIHTSNKGSQVEGGIGNDTINVKVSNEENYNTFIFNTGDGNDIIYNSGYWDKIRIYGLSSEEVAYEVAGNDLIIRSKLDKNDTIKLVGWNLKSIEERLNQVFFRKNMYDEYDENTNLNDAYKTLVGTNGNDVIDTLDSGWYIEAGKGNDTINITDPKSYENYIIYHAGDGKDVIHGSSNWEQITIYDIDPDKVSYNIVGDDLIIQSDVNPNDSITLKGWYTQYSADRLDNITFIDSNIGYTDEGFRCLSDEIINISGTSRAETITIDDEKCTKGYNVNPGKGNDTVNFINSSFEKEYIYKIGDGKDVINNSTNIETLRIYDMKPENFSYNRIGDDLVLQSKLLKTDAITLTNWFLTDEMSRTYIINFVDSKTGDSSYENIDTLYKTIYGTSGNNTLYSKQDSSIIVGNKGNDTINIVNPDADDLIIYRAGDGKDIINNSSIRTSVHVYDIDSKCVSYIKKGNDFIVQSTINANDSITFKNWYLQDSSSRVNSIRFQYDALGHDDGEYVDLAEQILTIVGTSRNDTINLLDDGNFKLNPGKGNDIINIGGVGTKYIDLTVGEGNTTINFVGNDIDDCAVELKFSPSVDRYGNTIQFSQYYAVSLDCKDLIICNEVYPENSKEYVERVTIKNYFENNYNIKNIAYNCWDGSFTIADLAEKNFNVLRMIGNKNSNTTFDATNLPYRIFFEGGNKYDVFNANQNVTSDYYTGDKGTKIVNSGKLDDYFDICYSTSDIVINDLGGEEDSLYFGDYRLHGDGWNMFFDVKNENYILEYGENEIPTETSLVMLKDSNILGWMKNKTSKGCLEITNWFETTANDGNRGLGYIEKFTIADGIDAKLVDVDKHIAKVVARVEECLNGTKYQTAMEALKDPKLNKALRDKLIACYTIESCPVELIYQEEYYPGENEEIEYWGVEKGEFYGSNGNDVIYSTKNSTLKGCSGNDKLYRGTYQEYVRDANGYPIWNENGPSLSEAKKASDYKLYGDAGNDVLEAGENVTISGGIGTNVIKINSDSSATIINGGTKAKDYLHFASEDLNFMDYKKENNDLIIENNSGSKTTLKDYFKHNNLYSVKGVIDVNSSATFNNEYYQNNFAGQIVEDISSSGNIKTIPELLASEDLKLINKFVPAKDKYTGTIYNDIIDAQGIKLKKIIKENGIKKEVERDIFDKGLVLNGNSGDDDIDGTKYSDTILGGIGDDEIRTGTGKDVVTGGIGHNTIEYETLDAVDGDTIILTKSEQLTLDFSTMSNLNFECKVNGKNFDVIVSDGNQTATLTIKDFGIKDVTNNSNPRKGIIDESYVKIRTSETDENMNFIEIDLRTVLLEQLNVVKNYTGTFHADNINARDYNILDKHKEVVTDWTKRGLTINTANGDDIIVGSNYSDTITGGVGDDTITGGTGNDKIYSGAGENTLIFNQGDGKDVIYMDKAGITDTINIVDAKKDTLSYSRSGNHLVINYGNTNDSITINNYFKTPNPTIDTINCKDGFISLSNIMRPMFSEDATFYEDEENTIVIGNGKFYSDLEGKDNYFYSTGKLVGVEAGNGNDSIQNNSTFLYANGGDGNDTYISSLNRITHIFDSSGDDVVKFAENKNNVNFLFDVSINAEGEIIDNSEMDGLFILNNAKLKEFKYHKNPERIGTYLDVQGYFKSNDSIDVFETKDDFYITRDKLEQLRGEIATWLSTTGTEYGTQYNSCIDVLASNDKAAINDLMLMYQNIEWQKY